MRAGGEIGKNFPMVKISGYINYVLLPFFLMDL